jgi:two-component system, LytTR family, response regulator LytT
MKQPGANKLRALIVEDEWPARNYLVELLEATGSIQVIGAVASVEETRSVFDRPKTGLDVVFVDIQLVADGEKAGLELAREIARLPPTRGEDAPAIVLATAFKQHAIEAFELGVVDYLLKPFSEERVEACVARLVARRTKDIDPPSTPARIVARRGRGLVFLEPTEVWAFEAADRLTSVHTALGVFDVDLSLSTIETSLGRSFARVHRNWLVNAEHIKQLDREGSETTLFVGSGLANENSVLGVTVPVARERAQGVREMLLSNAMGVRKS